MTDELKPRKHIRTIVRDAIAKELASVFGVEENDPFPNGDPDYWTSWQGEADPLAEAALQAIQSSGTFMVVRVPRTVGEGLVGAIKLEQQAQADRDYYDNACK